MDITFDILKGKCEKHGTFLHKDEDNFIIDGYGGAAIEAMEEYAKQQAISFRRWIQYYENKV